jgi:hypothetical protein
VSRIRPFVGLHHNKQQQQQTTQQTTTIINNHQQSTRRMGIITTIRNLLSNKAVLKYLLNFGIFVAVIAVAEKFGDNITQFHVSAAKQLSGPGTPQVSSQ